MKNKSFLTNPYFWLTISLLYLAVVIIFGFFHAKTGASESISNVVKDLFVPPKYPPLDFSILMPVVVIALASFFDVPCHT